MEGVYNHYLRGGLFENFVLSELLKYYYNNDRTPRLYFWRDKTEHEIDFVFERDTHLIPIEAKAGKTVSTSYFDNLKYWCNLANLDPKKGFVVYAGTEKHHRSSGTVLGWKDVQEVFN